MKDRRSIFFEEWQACLRSHYIHVLRTEDTVTEPTLRAVLLQSGLTEADLDALYHEALASVDDEPLPAPDSEPAPPAALDATQPDDYAEEAIEDDYTSELLTALEDTAQTALLPDEIEPDDSSAADDPGEPPPSTAQQLSMF